MPDVLPAPLPDALSADPSPVVLLHALATTPQLWTAPAAALRAAGHTVLTPWLPEPVTAAGEPHMDALVDQLLRLLDGEHIARATLVGCSMGGYLATSFLRRRPGRVDALVLISTRARADEPGAAAERREFARRFADPDQAAAMIAAIVPRLVGATTRRTRPAVVREVAAMAERVPARNVSWAQHAIAGRACAEDALRTFDGPVTVLAGAEDELMNPAEADRMALLRPDARVRVVRGAGHLLPVERPGVVTEAILDVLAARPVAGRGS